MKYSVKLPLPPAKLHPNGRTRSYMYRARLIKESRGWAKIAAIETLQNHGLAPGDPPRKLARARVYLFFTFADRRGLRNDPDNLKAWVKPYIDGIQDAGLIENDRGLEWTENPVLRVGKPGLEIVLETVRT